MSDSSLEAGNAQSMSDIGRREGIAAISVDDSDAGEVLKNSLYGLM